ncbi:cytochrome c oxidase subunit 3 [Sphingobium sp.]|uniref:cytochrome c oxidase subunit 3 n=1 Tax=Sphingobium sp. TaxID=1912891 RepID=UPI0028BE560E|nr:cytochrome c oxidase subunit 3 [Sphingobium sp.]
MKPVEILSEPTMAQPASAPAGQRVPGEPGLWVMIFGDLLAFGLFFVTFGVYRLSQSATFAASQARLNQGLGLLNTMLLLTSSLAIAIAVKALRERRLNDARQATHIGMALGFGFVGVKTIEYGEKFAAGITPISNDFFMFYFAFTAIHLLHVLVGLGALTFIRSRCAAVPTANGYKAVEGCAIFWHLVDILWVILFAILYLHP